MLACLETLNLLHTVLFSESEEVLVCFQLGGETGRPSSEPNVTAAQITVIKVLIEAFHNEIVLSARYF